MFDVENMQSVGQRMVVFNLYNDIHHTRGFRTKAILRGAARSWFFGGNGNGNGFGIVTKNRKPLGNHSETIRKPSGNQ